MRLTFREVMLGVRRSPLLSSLSVVTIAFSLFAFGLFGLLVLNVDRALRGVEEHVEIVAFLADGTLPEVDQRGDGRHLARSPRSRAWSRCRPSRRSRARARSFREFQDVFDASFLPPSIEVRLKEGHRDPDDREGGDAAHSDVPVRRRRALRRGLGEEAVRHPQHRGRRRASRSGCSSRRSR